MIEEPEKNNLLSQYLEALIFASEQSLSVQEIKSCLSESLGWEIEDEVLKEQLEYLRKKYEMPEFVFHLTEIAGGYQFLTKKEFYPVIASLLKNKSKKRLSAAALETLSIIAYRQPVTRTEIEGIRGVNSDYSIQKLLEKDLIEIAGKSDAPGRPVMYITSATFMDYFGINSAGDLPQLKDLSLENQQAGESF
jgi:segregation and condensation protein B